jgi:hypothetical protein
LAQKGKGIKLDGHLTVTVLLISAVATIIPPCAPKKGSFWELERIFVITHTLRENREV